MTFTKTDIVNRIGYFQNTAVFLADQGEEELCLKYLFMAEFYKDFLDSPCLL